MYPIIPIQALMSKAGLVPAQILLNHQQRIYAYCLLTLFNNYFIKKILPISFRDRDANTIGAEKQPKDSLI